MKRRSGIARGKKLEIRGTASCVKGQVSEIPNCTFILLENQVIQLVSSHDVFGLEVISSSQCQSLFFSPFSIGFTTKYSSTSNLPPDQVLAGL